MHPYTLDVSEEDFQTQVLEASRSLPVLVDFWAEWCGPCRVLKPVLEQLAEEYGGRFRLAKVDSDANQRLAGRFAIRGIPTVILFRDGEERERFSGAQPAPMIRQLLDRYVMTPGKELLATARQLLAAGDPDHAMRVLKDAQELEPTNQDIVLTLSACLLEKQAFEEARSVLRRIQMEDAAQELLARIDLTEKAASAGDADELARRLASEPGNLDLRFDHANALVAQGRFEDAMEELLTILRADRGFRDGAARTTMLSVFQLLGNSGELVSRYRRQLASVLN